MALLVTSLISQNSTVMRS